MIEDEARIASLVSRALDASGYDVTVAPDGLSGLKLTRDNGFELVILDLMLPDVDGFTVLRSMLDIAPDQLVIILSALADVDSKVRCLELGASDYICKPFDLPELLARIHVRLGPVNGGDRYLRSGGISLDLQRRIARRGEVGVSLATREFLLLEYLMRKEGQACAREELLVNVWGTSFNPGTNVVDVCVARLRQKLGGDCVETVRNVGYCFVGS